MNIKNILNYVLKTIGFDMKITDRQIAKEFGVTVQTLNNWKNGNPQLKKRYHALKNALIEDDMIIWEVFLKNGKKDYINNCIIGTYAINNKDDIISMRVMR